MLIVCNGVYKSGSTWMFMMLCDLVGQSEVPPEWRDRNQEGNIEVLSAPAEILAAARSRHLVAKMHSYEADYLRALRAAGAFMVVTSRDRAELLLSHYHHFSNEKLRLPFPLYAVTVGLFKAIEVEIYQQIATGPDCCDLFVSYEDLRRAPAATLRNVAEPLGFTVDQARLDEIVATTDMRGKTYEERFEGMKGRDWFFRRDPGANTEARRRLGGRIVALSRFLVGFRSLRRFFEWSSRLSATRSPYYRLRKHMPGRLLIPVATRNEA